MEKSIVYLPFYTREQYPRLLEIVSDIDLFDKKWEGWYSKNRHFVSEMESKGFECKEIVLDVEELNSYCLLNQLENNSSNRELFTLKIAATL